MQGCHRPSIYKKKKKKKKRCIFWGIENLRLFSPTLQYFSATGVSVGQTLKLKKKKKKKKKRHYLQSTINWVPVIYYVPYILSTGIQLRPSPRLQEICVPGVLTVTHQKWTRLVSLSMWPSGLRIWSCLEQQCRLQMQLESGVAVA